MSPSQVAKALSQRQTAPPCEPCGAPQTGRPPADGLRRRRRGRWRRPLRGPEAGESALVELQLLRLGPDQALEGADLVPCLRQLLLEVRDLGSRLGPDLQHEVVLEGHVLGEQAMLVLKPFELFD